MSQTILKHLKERVRSCSTCTEGQAYLELWAHYDDHRALGANLYGLTTSSSARSSTLHKLLDTLHLCGGLQLCLDSFPDVSRVL